MAKEEKHPGTSRSQDSVGKLASGKGHGPAAKGSTETELQRVYDNKIEDSRSSMGSSKDDVRVAY